MKISEKKQKNILIINCDWRNIFEAGWEEFYKKLERDRLEPDKHNFFFFSWSTASYRKKRDERFETIHIKTRFKFFRPFLDLMSTISVPYMVRISRFHPDIVLVYDFGFIPAAFIVKIFYGAKLILCLTNMPQAYSATRSFGRIKSVYSFFVERAFVKLVDVGYTINQAMKSYIIGIGLPGKKVVVFASDTIKRDMKHINASSKGRIRSRYGISENQKIILSVGRLEMEKGFPRLLDVFSKLDQSYILIILGQGSLRGALEEKARYLGIDKRVIFTGFVDRKNIWDYYRDADVFMLLSNVEALGLVFWEAMYMGVPAIGSTAPGIVESLGRRNERGIVIEPNASFEDILEKIKFCITPSREREAMLINAERFVEREISNTTSISDVI
ncbi:MAG: glycosyltransferase family 4 protein [Patescibacteria group bacterium]